MKDLLFYATNIISERGECGGFLQESYTTT
jgi:hypothetical protein